MNFNEIITTTISTLVNHEFAIIGWYASKLVGGSNG